MEPENFTEADLARLALSGRLKDLSEALRQAVAAPDGPVGDGPVMDGPVGDGPPGSAGSSLSERLLRLLESEVPALKSSLIGYMLTRGTAWSDVAEQTKVGEGEARKRWAAVGPEPVADPRAFASALDAWYVRHAQLEPLADVADPVSRLLSGGALQDPQEERCLICAKYAGQPVPAWAGRPEPPGGHLVDDGTWRVGHGPTAFWPRGTLLIESRRHFLDYGDITPEEAVSLGLLVRRLTAPIKAATAAPRVHLWSCMEGTPHFHLWLVPRTGEIQSGRAFIGNPGYCTETAAADTVHAIRRALEKEEENA
jgi:diadenosine tetraphosphate (Ap4A) HIT family hydrolase